MFDGCCGTEWWHDLTTAERLQVVGIAVGLASLGFAVWRVTR